MRIHQPVTPEIARAVHDWINSDLRADFDFSRVKIAFDVEFPGRQPWKWEWKGSTVSPKEITTWD